MLVCVLLLPLYYNIIRTYRYNIQPIEYVYNRGTLSSIYISIS